MDIYNELTDLDKNKIKSYLEKYNNVEKIEAPLDYILRFWNDEKKDLYQLLGNQFIVSKQIEYTKGADELEDDLRACTNAAFRTCLATCCDFFEHSASLPVELRLNRWNVIRLYQYHTLANNKYTGSSFKIELPNGETLAIQNGMKPMKALAKLNKVYHFCDEELFEEFRIVHSQILNQKKLSGNLTLSIHPLDYMTMSDNNCGWSSCMSWQEEGCYRMGTVEMMNSPVVVVAYLTANKDMAIDGNKIWNSKKWRQLFIINEDLIASIKAYPYKNEMLTKEVIYFLNELAKENWGWSYHTEKLLGYDRDQNPDYSFYFYTDYMYNDFGTTDHYIALKDLDEKDYSINYSGMTECMCCGETDNFPNAEEEASFLICCDCGNWRYCDVCDNIINPDWDKYYYLDGDFLCENCYYENAVKEFGADEIHWKDDLKCIMVYFDSTEETGRKIYCDDMQEYLKKGRDIQTKEVQQWYSTFVETYIYLDDLKPEWQEYLLNDYHPNNI